MSKAPEKGIASELVLVLSAGIAEMQRKEAERRAQMSPEARAQEDIERTRIAQERARMADIAKRRKIAERVHSVAAPFRQHRSFTIPEFACLLHGVKLGDFKVADWLPFKEPEVKAAQQTAEVLARGVRTTTEPIEQCPLVPLNPLDAVSNWRFPTGALMHFSKAERLGYVDDLDACFDAVNPSPAEGTGDGKAAPTVPSTSQPHAHILSEPIANAGNIQPAAQTLIEKPQWKQDTDTLMAEVKKALSAKGHNAKGSGDIHAAFCKNASMAALHNRYLQCFVPLEMQKGSISIKTFREYVRGEYPEFKFASGDRGNGHPDREYLRLLLDGE